MNIFDYEHANVPDDCKYLISPSQLGTFFEKPKIWYEETCLGNHDFIGNNASVIGTICHHAYESVTTGKPFSLQQVEEDYDKWFEAHPNPDVDRNTVFATFPPVITTVINEYVLPHQQEGIRCEEKIYLKIGDGIYVAGTFDRYEAQNGILCDYKTVSSKPSDSMPFHYRVQLLSYAMALKAQGNRVDYIRLIYGVKPTKTLGPRCFVVTEEVTPEAEKSIQDIFDLVKETLELIDKHPEYIHIIFKSMGLKK